MAEGEEAECLMFGGFEWRISIVKMSYACRLRNHKKMTNSLKIDKLFQYLAEVLAEILITLLFGQQRIW